MEKEKEEKKKKLLPKVLFVNVPTRTTTPPRHPNIGVAFLSAVLKQEGYDVDYLDCPNMSDDLAITVKKHMDCGDVEELEKIKKQLEQEEG